ncbi:SIS domain-containing protein [Paenibacillus thermotolerans]|uniref:SIS domain-containing protein n=1 Tax=Paenibacillus thermotolerans TaxID=3027807 RepID=UPI002367BAEE|nr:MULTISPECIES: SIS domain-containing protein [unclassified Paenibacillus]
MMFGHYYREYATQYINTLQTLDFSIVERIFHEMDRARRDDRQVFVVGNGGSAASASHWACDFGKGINVDGAKRLRVTSLADNAAWMTALGNDLSYGDIFAEQLKNSLRPGDVVVGLSVSGNSENVVRAFQYAKEQGAIVIALVGAKKGRMEALADIALVIPSEDYGIVEDVHMFVNHVISQHMKQVNVIEAEAAVGGEGL